MKPLISIGGAVLRAIGLSPQKITGRITGRAIVTPTWAGNDIQLTGADPQVTELEAVTLPQVFGGLDAVEVLALIARWNVAVPYIRLGGGYLGLVAAEVVVQEMEVIEERLAPNGTGRIVRLTTTLLHTGDLGFGGFG